MSAAPNDAPITRILDRLEDVRRSGNGYSALCPAHADTHPSLSVSQGMGGRVVLKCHKGCTIESIVAAMGITMPDLFATPAFPQGAVVDQPVADHPVVDVTYDYVDAQGILLFQTVRQNPKGFRQRRPDGKGGWIWSMGNVPRPLYNLPGVIAAVARAENAGTETRPINAYVYWIIQYQ